MVPRQRVLRAVKTLLLVAAESRELRGILRQLPAREAAELAFAVRAERRS